MNSASRSRQRLRLWCRRPLALMVVLLAAGLGIAVNTAVVNLAWTALVDSLLGPQLDRLLMLSERQPTGGNSPLIYSPAGFYDLRTGNLSFADIAAFDQKYTTLASLDGSMFLLTSSVSAGFFDMLDTQPQLGRTFLSQEDQPGNAQVVVLSDRLWKEHFGADPKLIGETIALDKKNFKVVGIMSPGFQFPDQTDVWMPLALGPSEKEEHTSYYLNVLARLKPGITIRQAQAELRGYLKRVTPQTSLSATTGNVLLDPVYDHLKGNLQTLGRLIGPGSPKNGRTSRSHKHTTFI